MLLRRYSVARILQNPCWLPEQLIQNLMMVPAASIGNLPLFILRNVMEQMASQKHVNCFRLS